MSILTSVDTWFLVVLVLVLGMFFLWAVKYIFDGLKKSIADLGTVFHDSTIEIKTLIADLFNHRNDHEGRLIALETKCAWEHGEAPYDQYRQTGGRRPYDPSKPIVTAP